MDWKSAAASNSRRAFLRVISIASFRFTGCWSSFNPFLLRRPPIVKSLPFLILQFTWNELLQYSKGLDCLHVGGHREKSFSWRISPLCLYPTSPRSSLLTRPSESVVTPCHSPRGLSLSQLSLFAQLSPLVAL